MMKITIINKSIKIGDVEIQGVGSSSVVLIGDTETITSSSYFDTPEHALIFNPNVPFKQPGNPDNNNGT